jgi:hypothetical protein
VFQRPADDLVHRIVATDVLAHGEHASVDPEQRGGVQAAGGGKDLLRLPQAVRHPPQRVRGHSRGIVAG